MQQYHDITQQELDSRIEAAQKYLEANLPENRIYPTFIAPSRQMCRPDLQITEYFSSALIAMALKPENPVRQKILEAFYHLAVNHELFTFYPAPVYPPDTDTNSLIYSLLIEQGYDVFQQANALMSTIKQYMSPAGVVQVWLSKDRINQTDEIVSINAEILAVYLQDELSNGRNRRFIVKHLENDKFWNGTRYYHSPDAFLYFLLRLIKADSQLGKQIFPALQKAAYDRRQSTCYPLDLAHRIAVFQWTGIDYSFELEQLLRLQGKDGSLPADAFFHFGGIRGYFGSEFITTAFFINALETIKTNNYET